jgi:hypothetical protein
MTVKVNITESELLKVLSNAINQHGINGVQFKDIKVKKLRVVDEWSNYGFQLEIEDDRNNDW